MLCPPPDPHGADGGHPTGHGQVCGAAAGQVGRSGRPTLCDQHAGRGRRGVGSDLRADGRAGFAGDDASHRCGEFLSRGRGLAVGKATSRRRRRRGGNKRNRALGPHPAGRTGRLCYLRFCRPRLRSGVDAALDGEFLLQFTLRVQYCLGGLFERTVLGGMAGQSATHATGGLAVDFCRDPVFNRRVWCPVRAGLCPFIRPRGTNPTGGLVVDVANRRVFYGRRHHVAADRGDGRYLSAGRPNLHATTSASGTRHRRYWRCQQLGRGWGGLCDGVCADSAAGDRVERQSAGGVEWLGWPNPRLS